MNGATNTQRALWMVLITSLAAPFLASLTCCALMIVLPVLGLPLPPFASDDHAASAVAIFAWSALPATVAALGLVPYVLQSGTFGWLHAAVAGVLAFGASAVILNFDGGGVMPLLAFLAGLIAVLMRAFLLRTGIITP